MPHLLHAARSIAAFLLAADALIIAHELGHLLAARAFGVRAAKFTIGIGPTLATRRDRHGTTWRLALIPAGGYVSFHGDTNAGAPVGYGALPPLPRMAIIAAGPVANILATLAIFAAILATTGETAYAPIANTVIPNSAADHAGFEAGDRILDVAGNPVDTFEELRLRLQAHAGETIDVVVLRQAHTVSLRPKLADPEHADGILGVSSDTVIHIPVSPGQVIVRAVAKTRETLTDTIAGVAQAVTTGRGADNFAGVVGIAHLTAQATDQGTETLLNLVAIISANLALMNLLPIPVLDGGALLFCLAELIFRRAVSARVQEIGTGAGVSLLVTLFVLSLIHDVRGLGFLRWLGQM